MTDPDWWDEPYPLDRSITWREHYEQKFARPHTTHHANCGCANE